MRASFWYFLMVFSVAFETTSAGISTEISRLQLHSWALHDCAVSMVVFMVMLAS